MEENERLQMRTLGPGRRWQKRSTEMNALLMDAQRMLSEEECANGMGQVSKDAAVKDAQTKPSKEECA